MEIRTSEINNQDPELASWEHPRSAERLTSFVLSHLADPRLSDVEVYNS